MQLVGFDHREGEDVGGHVLAAPLGVQRADLRVAAQTKRDLDGAGRGRELRKGAFGDCGMGGTLGERPPGGATVPLRVGLKTDIKDQLPGPS